ncbi:hypothetical protein AX774_g7384, partial [Zancudomyces culisetae]
MTIQTPNVLA